jgi:hypothetical protein
MKRTGPDDRRIHVEIFGEAAEWIGDRPLLIGKHAATGESVRFILRTFTVEVISGKFWVVEAWADWAIDDPSRPQPAITMSFTARFGREQAEEETANAITQMCNNAGRNYVQERN